MISHSDRKVRLVVPQMLEWLARLDPQAAGAPKEFPFMLAAGGRRMFNANQIFRDPAWRRDDPDGAMLINSSDLNELGAKDGDWIAVELVVGRLVVRCKVDDAMRNGQLALPHGYGQAYPTSDGERLSTGRVSICSPRAATAILLRARPTTRTSRFVWLWCPRTRLPPISRSPSEFI